MLQDIVGTVLFRLNPEVNDRERALIQAFRVQIENSGGRPRVLRYLIKTAGRHYIMPLDPGELKSCRLYPDPSYQPSEIYPYLIYKRYSFDEMDY